MKKLISILVMATLFMMSCKKDFIEISPKSTITSDLLFKTDKDFQDALIGCYSELQPFYKYFWKFGDLPGEDCDQYATREQQNVHIDNFIVDVNENILKTAWGDLYQIIERVNTLLSKIKDADVTIVTNKELYVGEAKFIRALAYFNLVRIFGDVPLITAPITVNNALKTSRENVDVIYDELIISDLMESEAKLPVTNSSANEGRVTKGAAKSLLGKVYLTRKDFVKAEAKLKEVTTMGYALLTNFNDLFNFDNEHHSEYIFDVEYIDGNVGLGSDFTKNFLPDIADIGQTLNKAIRTVYGITTNEGTDGGAPSQKFLSAFDPNDLRKYRTATTGIFDTSGKWVPIPSGALVPIFTQKFMAAVVTDSKINWRVIRYADVLLMLAEALNENSKTNEALTYLNQVRTRAGLSGYSSLTQSEAREKIYLERRFELYMEGQRWFDLVRTGRALSVMSSYGMKPHMTVFPIPQSQIEVVNNPDIFSQNQGY
jgi:starch-binding outer membrane protein, SusD/RagB family